MAKRNMTQANSYGAKKTVIIFRGERVQFDSKMEALEADRLQRLERRSIISSLELQPRFELMGSFKIATSSVKSGISTQGAMRYTPDFKYITAMGEVVVVEVKGFADAAYKLRQKIFLSKMKDFGVDEFIVTNGKKHTEYRRVK